MASVPGEKFGFVYLVHPAGRGSVTFRSVSLSSGICSPPTPTLDRYSAIETGRASGSSSALVSVGLVGVVQIAE